MGQLFKSDRAAPIPWIENIGFKYHHKAQFIKEYGSLATLKAQIEYKTVESTKMIASGYLAESDGQEVYVNILSKDEYFVYISGYLRKFMSDHVHENICLF